MGGAFLYLGVVAAGVCAAPPSRLLSLAAGLDPEAIRIEIGWSGPAQYQLSTISHPSRVVIDLTGAALGDVPRKQAYDDPALRALRAQPWRDGVRVVADLAYPLYEVSASARDDGAGLVVTISRRYWRASRVPVAPGVDYGHIRMGIAAGPVLVNYIAIDMHHPSIVVRPALAGPHGPGQETVSEMSQRLGAIAAVNGIYFSTAGRPLGLLAMGQELISPPIYARTAFGWFEDGGWLMQRVDLAGEVRTEAGTFALQTVNGRRTAGQIAQYTPAYGPVSPTDDSGRSLAVIGGEVIEVARGSQPIPPEGYVVVADNDGPLSGLGRGDRLEAEWRLMPSRFNQPLRFAIGGGPRLVEGGRVAITAAAERFRPDVAVGRAPRTALGVTDEDELLLVVVNGRQEGLSIGLTLEELAELMIELGAKDAMNLDGGGSSTLVVRDRVLNMPSGGAERPVNNALLVFASERS
ncbi:MAG TPA: phosphodiester glycosidase family protein [Limnochordia bacterium]